MAKLYFKNKNYKLAEKTFNDYLVNNPTDFNALKTLAQVYEQLRDYDKAFETYEKCYMTEPDRTSVLLDICRILQRCDVSANVDPKAHKRWLNLATKAFPSNPIVTDFRDYVSKSFGHADEDPYLSPQRLNNSSISFRQPPSDDTLTKILEKLTLMEAKISNIERGNSTLLNRLDTIEKSVEKSNNQPAGLAKATLFQVQQQHTPAPANAPQPQVQPSTPAIATPLKVQQPTQTFASQPQIQQQPAVPKNSPLTQPQSPAPASVPQVQQLAPSLFSSPVVPWNSNPTNLFGGNPKPFSVPIESPWTKSSVGDVKKNDSPAKKEERVAEKAPGFLSNSTPTNRVDSAEKSSQLAGAGSAQPAPSLFNSPFGSWSTNSTNPFSDGLKKLNMPVEGSWTTKSSPGAGFSKSQPSDNKDDEDNDDDGPAENEELAIENTCDMQPIAYKTGEEDETNLFEHRCKLFRFRDKEYKERGLGNIKVLQHKETGAGRLIMRREAIGLVCLNCWDCSKIERVRDTQVRWYGLDASDGQAEGTVFLAKFKTPELTDTFEEHLQKLFSDKGNSSLNVSKSNGVAPAHSDDTPEVELVNPKLDPVLVQKAKALQLPDMFYHKLPNQRPCSGCAGCDDDD